MSSIFKFLNRIFQKSKIYLLIIFFYIYCNNSKSLVLPAKTTFYENKISLEHYKSGIEEIYDNEEEIYNHKKIIIFLHGLATNEEVPDRVANFNKMRKILIKRFQDKNLSFYTVPIYNSSTIDIRSNSTEIYNKIVKKIKGSNYELILIGHSLGGFFAYSIYQKYKKKLDIKGILTIGTPWDGVYLSKAKSESNSLLLNMVINQLEKKFAPCDPAIIDVSINSVFLNWVKSTISNVDIPMCLIGGKSNYMKNLFKTRIFSKGLSGAIFSATGNFEKKLLGSNENDGMVPISSQIAKELKIKAKRVVVKSPTLHHNLIREIVIESFEKLLKPLNLKKSLSEIKEIESEPQELNSDEVIKEVGNFIEECYF